MAAKRRSLTRPEGFKRYRKLFIIAVEGKETEKQYFQLFNSQDSVIQVKCLSAGSKSAPFFVLKRLVEFLAKQGLKNDDEAWLVVDKDSWPESQLLELYIWSKQATNRGFALSNPCFEYWLLLHYEDVKGISTTKDCTSKLEQYIPNYNKHLNAASFTQERVNTAIATARKRDNPPCVDWPKTTGTTVYRLVQKLVVK